MGWEETNEMGIDGSFCWRETPNNLMVNLRIIVFHSLLSVYFKSQTEISVNQYLLFKLGLKKELYEV